MKKITVIITIAGLALAFGLSACTDAEMAQVEKDMNQAANNSMKTGGVYSPSQGVLCDTKAGFCADSYGISMGLTKEYLGQAAQDKLMSYKDFDTSEFTMTNGVYCDSKMKKCYNNKWKEKVDTYYTGKLF